MMLRMTVALCSNIAVDSVAALWYVVVLRTPCTQLRLRELSQFILGCADVTPLGVFNI